MAEVETAIKDKIAQLNLARSLVLQDPTHYPDILKGILPIIVASSSVIELRRWGAEFLAETFSSPLINAQKKQELALVCLDPLATLLGEAETGILKNVIQCSSSIYPLVFRYICHNKSEAATWQKMAAIKSKILSMLDSGTEGVRLACIKFVQRIVLVQTPGASDPRLADKSEVSLSIVPLNHPLFNIHALEAEAHGLLDRILNVFQDTKLDAATISATLNCLPALVKGRSMISNKILNVLMAYNPISLASKSTSYKERFIARSLDKTVRATLTHLARASSQGPHANKINQHVQRLVQAKSEFSIEPPRSSSKRVLSGTDTDSVKRAKYRNAVEPGFTPTPPPPQIQIQPSNGTTYKTLYTLTPDPTLQHFDVTQLTHDMACQINLATLFSLQQPVLDVAVNSVRTRLASLIQAAAAAAAVAAPPPRPLITHTSNLDDDDDDYNPAGGDNPAILPLNHPTASQTEGMVYSDSEDSYEIKDVVPGSNSHTHNKNNKLSQSAAMDLVKMPLLTGEELKEASEGTLDRMFDTMSTVDKNVKKERAGVTRLAGTTWDKDAWLTVLSRLSTRGLAGIDSEIQAVAREDRVHHELLSEHVRQRLHAYVIEDFRTRMDAAVSWLNEEWYNDKLAAKAGLTGDEKGGGGGYEPQYEKWVIKVMDGVFPYLESSDRNVFLRVLSELPAIPSQVLMGIRGLCLDPERAAVGFLALHYLCMLKPPVRNECLDIAEELWHNHNDVKTSAKKILARFRPQVVGIAPKPAVVNGS